MSGGFGFRNWGATLPPAGEDWHELHEFNALSDRAFREQLKLVRHSGALKPGEIALIGIVRNEALRLPLFFDHYKKLGVTRFFMVDNASEDSTADILLAEPSADIFHTEASYRDACSGIYWINGLARAWCVGHWVLMADADELFVFDGAGRHSLTDFTTWLESHGQDRVFAPMIDVYPRHVIGESGLSVKENFERNSWFDASGYAVQPKYTGWLVTGGPRQRLFTNKTSLVNGEWSSKYPLFHMTAETAIFHAHFVWPEAAGPPRPFGALMHLKFMDDFAERVSRNVREGQHYDNSLRYRVVSEKLAEKPRQEAFSAVSRRYEGPESLVRHNLILPIDWHLANGQALAQCRTLGDIDYRVWSGMGRPTVISESERDEFEDFSRRAFDSHLKVVRSRGVLGTGEMGLICVLRNEAARLPLFFEHYKRMGITRFLMVDNNSDDGTHDVLLAEPSADIFHTQAPFSEGQGGLFWAQALARRYCEDRWILRADADELFVYDRMEERDLGALARWLEAHGMDRIYAPIIDLYPSTAVGHSSQAIAELIETDAWFDNDGYSLERWPQGWRLTGGPRYRLFHQDGSHINLMWKYPFFHMRPDTVIFNHHWLWPYDDVTRGALGAMVHLKLMHDFIERSERYEREAQHFANSNAYRVMNEKMKSMPEVVAFYEGSKRYRGPQSLLMHGMLMSIDWESEAGYRDGGSAE